MQTNFSQSAEFKEESPRAEHLKSFVQSARRLFSPFFSSSSLLFESMAKRGAFRCVPCFDATSRSPTGLCLDVAFPLRSLGELSRDTNSNRRSETTTENRIDDGTGRGETNFIVTQQLSIDQFQLDGHQCQMFECQPIFVVEGVLNINGSFSSSSRERERERELLWLEWSSPRLNSRFECRIDRSDNSPVLNQRTLKGEGKKRDEPSLRIMPGTKKVSDRILVPMD